VDADAPAAERDAADADARAHAYGSVKEWSYERAVVEFYVALRRDVTSDGAFNTVPFLSALRAHRCFVVPRRSYDASVAAHAVAPVLLAERDFKTVVDDVYRESATARKAT
jgi:hypothetical protein